MIDCHAHLYPPNFSFDEIQKLTEDEAVDRILVVPENAKESQTVLDLANRFSRLISPLAGLHPLQKVTQGPLTYRSVRMQEWDDTEPWIRCQADALIGLGECGLDYSKQWVPERDSQLAVFDSHIRLANELGLPLNVHSRNAGHYAVDALIQRQAKGVLHAFDGKVGYALKAVSHGLFLSIPPSILRSESLVKLVKHIPLDHLLLESDAPSLGPVKGDRNAPSNISLSCAKIAEIKGLSFDIVAEMTTENAYKVFTKLPPRLSKESY